jgi:hypothetical protein
MNNTNSPGVLNIGFIVIAPADPFIIKPPLPSVIRPPG